MAWDTIAKTVVKPWGFLVLALASYLWLARGGDAAILTPAEALIAAYIASLALAAIAAFYALFRVFGSQLLGPKSIPDLRETLSFARTSLPIAINETAVFAFRRIDIIILALVAGPTATGIYYLAQQVGTVVEVVLVSPRQWQCVIFWAPQAGWQLLPARLCSSPYTAADRHC